jgi:hypothetical protein
MMRSSLSCNYRYRSGIFAAWVVIPLIAGISHHEEGNNIYRLYGAIDRLLPNSRLEPAPSLIPRHGDLCVKVGWYMAEEWC